MTTTQATVDYYKFCPGAERVKISNAICLGRRRSHYPKCQGCQFNGDEVGSASAAAVMAAPVDSTSVHCASERPRSSPVIASLFHTYDISGVVPEPLSEDAAWRIGNATAQFLLSKLRGYDRADPNTRSLVVGRDTRQHSITLENALIEGVRATGSDVVSLGQIDTGLLHFAVNRLSACGGIQITGGHRPADYNGFRVCGTKATPLALDTGLASIRDIAARTPQHRTGSRSRLITKDLSQDYVEFVREFLAARIRLPRPFKVVVDAGNGVAGKWFPMIFKGMRNLRITRLNFDTKGEFAHDPNPMRAKNTREMRQAVKDQGADFGICLDTSAGRAVLADDKARTIRPELLGVLLARQFIERQPGAAVVYDHRSSVVVEEEIVRAGGIPIRERAGPTFIKKTMSERNAVFGADLSGGYYFRDNFYAESGILAFVHVINLMLASDQSLSELIRPLQRYSSLGPLRFRCTDMDDALHQITEAHRDAALDQLDGLTFRYPDWWFNVRPFPADHTLNIMLEARTKALADQKLTELSPLIGERA